MMRFLIFVFIILISIENGLAQNVQQKHIETESKKSLSLDIPFNTEDIFIGISLYKPIFPKYNISILGAIYIRPFAKKELVRQTQTNYNLYREYRHHTAIGLHNYINIFKDFSIYSSLAVGIMAIYRRGSNTDFWELVRPITNVGICTPKIQSKYFNYNFQFGYKYLATNSFEGHYFYFSLSLLEIL